jgi:hypothetical protein
MDVLGAFGQTNGQLAWIKMDRLSVQSEQPDVPLLYKYMRKVPQPLEILDKSWRLCPEG